MEAPQKISNQLVWIKIYLTIFKAEPTLAAYCIDG